MTWAAPDDQAAAPCTARAGPVTAARRLLGPALLLLLFPLPLASQDRGWNGPRALELLSRTQARRVLPHADSGLTAYRAQAEGHLYFYVARPGGGRMLVKADQVALEIYWKAPHRTKQRIIGRRDEARLPHRLRYHLDHLTIVQDEFGDQIHMGHGDEVRGVLHPAAPRADTLYEYRLADSLTLRLPSAPEPVRVYELQVRPRDFGRAAIIGSVFVDRASAAIVRMRFTFTPASYIDPRVERIHVSLDNGLWEGRYWLPNEQRIEIRRQVPALDLDLATVISGVYRISGYELDTRIPDSFFAGPSVVALPGPLLERHEFRTGLFAELDDDVLATPGPFEALRQQSLHLVGARRLSGLPGLRLHLDSISAVLRYNRGEALFFAGGAEWRPAAPVGFEARLGYATGPDHLHVAGALDLVSGPRLGVRAAAFGNALRDLGTRPGVPGAFSSLATALTGDDYVDPYFADGAWMRVERRFGARWSTGLTLAAESHGSARLKLDDALLDRTPGFRPVRAVDEGTLVEGRLELRRRLRRTRRADWGVSLDIAAGDLDGREYVRGEATVTRLWRTRGGETDLELGFGGGGTVGDPPAQRLFLLGGPGTLPGYEFRSLAGSRYALLEAVASHRLIGPWLRIRGRIGAAWTDADPGELPAAWDVRTTAGVQPAAGLGVGLFYDLLRIDAARGLDDGRWEAAVSVSPDLLGLL